MGKVILVLDKMPENCAECPALRGPDEFCNASGIVPTLIEDIFSHPDWCPLKELPKRLPITADIDYITGYNTGWNDCIEHIEED